MVKRCRTGLLAGLALLVAGGCKQEITLTHYPPFDVQAIESLAVAPFAEPADAVGAGRTLAGAIARQLEGNGPYRVIGPDALTAGLQGGGDAHRPAEESIARRQALSAGADALLVGVVSAYGTRRNVLTDIYYTPPYYAYGQYGCGYYGRGRFGISYVASGWYERSDVLHNEAEVELSARLIDPADGRTLHRLSEPISVTAVSQGAPPALSLREALAAARGRAVSRVVEQFAPTPITLEVRPDQTLWTARADGTRTDEFTGADREVVVWVRLPAEADRNALELVIRQSGQARSLATAAFTWQRGWSRRGRSFVFQRGDLSAETGGAEDYQAELYHGTRRLLRCRFEIER